MKNVMNRALVAEKKLFILLAAIVMSVCLMAQDMEFPPVYPASPNARYRLFPTKNMYMFIELDTKTGKMNQLQWSTKGDEYRFSSILSDRDLTFGDSTATAGRFTLYPTTNIYNFILLDQEDGRTWQVQWNHDKDKRIVTFIW